MSQGIIFQGIMFQGIMSQGIMSQGIMSQGIQNLSALSLSKSTLSPSLPHLLSCPKVSRLEASPHKLFRFIVSHIKVSRLKVSCFYL